MSSLADRLRRLDRAGPSPRPELRDRLDRAWPAARPGRCIPLERIAAGERIDTPAGPVLRVERTAPADRYHGRLPVARLAEIPVPALRELFPEELGPVADAREIAFLDTETTGLAGGAGTVAFLVGVGRWDPEAPGFRVVQLFLEDLDREAALLHALARELRGTRCLVTFNGRRFDVPLLETRHVLSRVPWPLAGVPHLDLLPPGRTLWRGSHPDCRLTTLEAGVLGIRRQGDVPGSEIPAVYLRYLREGDTGRMPAVFLHNRLDIVSLAGLLWAVGAAAESPGGTTAYGVGLLHARRRRHEQAREALESCLAGRLGRTERLRALRELGSTLKARGMWTRALEVWAEMRRMDPGSLLPVEEAAKALEHRLGDPAGALGIVEEALSHPWWTPRDREALEHRRARLLRKTATPPPDDA